MARWKLAGVEIEGFRRFRSPLRVELTHAGRVLDYLVLAGPNGCGKTTVLEAILLALGRQDLIVRDLGPAARRASPRVAVPPGGHVAVVLRDLDGGEEVRFERGHRGARRWRVLPDGGRAVLSESDARALLGGFQVEYISSRRLPALVGPVQDSIRGRPPADTEANRIWRLKHRIRQQQGRRVPGYTGPEPRDREWLERLNDFWRRFRDDGTRLVMDLVDPDDLDVNEWDLMLVEDRGDEVRRICSVDALSSGEQEIISLVAPFITEPFDGLLLFDEPELHLHPEWQGRVVRALRAVVPEAQVVVATHADDPWDDAMSWERVLLVEADDPRSSAGREGR